MSPSAWKPNTPSTHTLLRTYQAPPRGDFIAYLDSLMAEQQARLRKPSATPVPARKQAISKATQPAQTNGPTNTQTQAATNKRIKATSKTKQPIVILSKPHIVWLIIAFVLTIIVPPVGSVLLLWSVAKILVLKLKTSNTNT